MGAIVGGAAGYLFFTEQRRTARGQIEPALEDFSREVINFRNAVQKAAGVASEGRKLLSDTLNEVGKPTSWYPTGQRSPF